MYTNLLGFVGVGTRRFRLVVRTDRMADVAGFGPGVGKEAGFAVRLGCPGGWLSGSASFTVQA